MSRRTNTKHHRRILEKVGENPDTKKPLLAATGEYMPPQDRQWVEFQAADGRKCGTWISAGQAINTGKFFKRPRHYDNDKKLWV